jgi:hypothetical protein
MLVIILQVSMIVIILQARFEENRSQPLAVGNPLVNFPFISSNIPASPLYGVYIHNSYVILELVHSTVQ